MVQPQLHEKWNTFRCDACHCVDKIFDWLRRIGAERAEMHFDEHVGESRSSHLTTSTKVKMVFFFKWIANILFYFIAFCCESFVFTFLQAAHCNRKWRKKLIEIAKYTSMVYELCICVCMPKNGTEKMLVATVASGSIWSMCYLFTDSD